MPEIAEVETVRNILKDKILNKKITDVNILYSGIIKNDLETFKSILINNKFSDILRIGKWLIFELNDHYLLSHLRMEGKYFIKNPTDPIVKHEHIIITFADYTDLRYHDTRKFGVMKIIAKKDLYDTEEIKKQGKEVLDSTLDANYLLKNFKTKKLPIKTVLLDQSIISGLGNIYVDEVLYASKIHPLRLAKDITYSECEKIINESNRIITKAIAYGGTTIKSYTSSLGVTGNYQQFLKVHTKNNTPCEVCHNLIEKIKVGGRGTYLCPKCQK